MESSALVCTKRQEPNNDNVPSSSLVGQTVNVPRVTNYTLSKERCLTKILKACDRENYSIEKKAHCANVLFNAASFHVYRKALARFWPDSTKITLIMKRVVLH